MDVGKTPRADMLYRTNSVRQHDLPEGRYRLIPGLPGTRYSWMKIIDRFDLSVSLDLRTIQGDLQASTLLFLCVRMKEEGPKTKLFLLQMIPFLKDVPIFISK
jgi:hypothetical protein